MTVSALNQAQTQALFKERYRDLAVALYEAGYDTCTKIDKRTDMEKVGPRGLIIAKKMRPGGQVRTWSPDGGDMKRGTGAQYAAATVTAIPLLVALEATRASQWYTASTDIAIKNAIKDQLKDGTTEYKAQLDRYLFGAGDGIMGTFASGSGTTYVMSAPIGTRWLRAGHSYELYTAGAAAARGQTVTIDTIDHKNLTIVLTASPSVVPNATDVLLPEGVTGATPAWYLGFRYHFSSAATGFWLNLNRATYPQIRTVEITAGSGPLVQTHIRALKNRMQLYREKCFDRGNWEVVWNPAQAQAYEELGYGVNQYPKNQPSRTGLEVMYDPNQFSVDGMKPHTTPNQNPTVIDITNWDNWFRVETVPFGLYTVDEVSTFPVYGASGGLTSSDVMYMAGIHNYAVDDPQLGGYVSNLAIPEGYAEFGS